MIEEGKLHTMEIDAIKTSLGEIKATQVVQASAMESQRLVMEQLLITVRGSINYGVAGMMTDVKLMKERLDKIEEGQEALFDWKSDIDSSKGKITITIGTLFQRSLAAIGAAGTVVAIVLGLKELLS